MIDCKINKNIEVETKIDFILGNTLISGIIIEKTPIGKGDISFLIKTDGNKFCRVKHRCLDLFYIYKT